MLGQKLILHSIIIIMTAFLGRSVLSGDPVAADSKFGGTK